MIENQAWNLYLEYLSAWAEVNAACEGEQDAPLSFIQFVKNQNAKQPRQEFTVYALCAKTVLADSVHGATLVLRNSIGDTKRFDSCEVWAIAH